MKNVKFLKVMRFQPGSKTNKLEPKPATCLKFLRTRAVHSFDLREKRIFNSVDLIK